MSFDVHCHCVRSYSPCAFPLHQCNQRQITLCKVRPCWRNQLFSELTAAAGWAAPPGWGTWVSLPPLGGAVSGAGPPGCAWRPASWGSAPTPSASAGKGPSPGSPAGTPRHKVIFTRHSSTFYTIFTIFTVMYDARHHIHSTAVASLLGTNTVVKTNAVEFNSPATFLTSMKVIMFLMCEVFK